VLHNYQTFLQFIAIKLLASTVLLWLRLGGSDYRYAAPVNDLLMTTNKYWLLLDYNWLPIILLIFKKIRMIPLYQDINSVEWASLSVCRIGRHCHIWMCNWRNSNSIFIGFKNENALFVSPHWSFPYQYLQNYRF